MNISFSQTTAQMRAKQKTVTRRLDLRGYFRTWLKPGSRHLAIVKAQGIPKGGHVEPLGFIDIVDVRVEPLEAITQADVTAEGFAMTPAAFVTMYMHKYRCLPEQIVTRIEFRHVV